MSNSVIDTAAEMSIIVIGNRIVSGIILRINKMEAFDTNRTKSVAEARLRAVTVDVLTASNGHSPSNCTSAGLFFHRESKISLVMGALLMGSLALIRKETSCGD